MGLCSFTILHSLSPHLEEKTDRGGTQPLSTSIWVFFWTDKPNADSLFLASILSCSNILMCPPKTTYSSHTRYYPNKSWKRITPKWWTIYLFTTLKPYTLLFLVFIYSLSAQTLQPCLAQYSCPARMKFLAYLMSRRSFGASLLADIFPALPVSPLPVLPSVWRGQQVKRSIYASLVTVWSQRGGRMAHDAQGSLRGSCWTAAVVCQCCASQDGTAHMGWRGAGIVSSWIECIFWLFLGPLFLRKFLSSRRWFKIVRNQQGSLSSALWVAGRSWGLKLLSPSVLPSPSLVGWLRHLSSLPRPFCLHRYMERTLCEEYLVVAAYALGNFQITTFPLFSMRGWLWLLTMNIGR